MTWKNQLYNTLRLKCGFTHHEARRIMLDHYGSFNHFKDVLHDEGVKEAEAFAEEIDAIVALAASAPTPEEASLRIFNACWPDYPDRDIGPILPYLVASHATRKVAKALRIVESKDKQKLWYKPKKILRFENSRAKREYKERHIATYLTIVS